MPKYGVMALKRYEWVIIYTYLYMWCDNYKKTTVYMAAEDIQ